MMPSCCIPAKRCHVGQQQRNGLIQLHDFTVMLHYTLSIQLQGQTALHSAAAQQYEKAQDHVTELRYQNCKATCVSVDDSYARFRSLHDVNLQYHDTVDLLLAHGVCLSAQDNEVRRQIYVVIQSMFLVRSILTKHIAVSVVGSAGMCKDGANAYASLHRMCSL